MGQVLQIFGLWFASNRYGVLALHIVYSFELLHRGVGSSTPDTFYTRQLIS